MRKLLLITCFTGGSLIGLSQKNNQQAMPQKVNRTFESSIATAKNSLTNNQLLDAHSHLLLALQDLELTMCKKVLALLPDKIDGMPRQTDVPEVTGLAGSLGNTIERLYNGEDPSGARINITLNSLMVAASAMTTPDVTTMGATEDKKMVEVNGYKGKLQRERITDTVFSYTLFIQMGTSMIEFQMRNVSEEKMMKHAHELRLKELGEWLE